MSALKAAGTRGIDVRILIDGFGDLYSAPRSSKALQRDATSWLFSPYLQRENVQTGCPTSPSCWYDLRIMKHAIFLSMTLVGLWLAISGVYKPLLFVLGVVSIGLVIWVSLRMKIVGEEHNPLVFSWRLPVFWLWALKEIFQANLHVARLVFQPDQISPRIVRVPVPLDSSLAKVVYGNTCTLTPGTVTLTLDHEKLVAHALDERSAEALVSGRLARKVQWLEGSREAHQ